MIIQGIVNICSAWFLDIVISTCSSTIKFSKYSYDFAIQYCTSYAIEVMHAAHLVPSGMILNLQVYLFLYHANLPCQLTQMLMSSLLLYKCICSRYSMNSAWMT